MDVGEFKTFLEHLYVHPAADALWEKIITPTTPVLTAEAFQANWFKKVQGVDVPLDSVKEIIASSEPPKKDGSAATKLSSVGFQSYLFNTKYNALLSADRAKLFQDMNQPAAHYYIASSHNTYLAGHQLTGESSVDAYVHAFDIGCRCVELDCWDSPDGPIIYHGHTLTTKIFFKDVIATVRDHAFAHTDYPAVLSLEMHCGVEGQNEIARLIKETLGPAGMLIDEHVEKTGLQSPSKYLKKVLIKGKMVPFLEEEDEDPAEEAEQPDPKKKGGKQEEIPADAKKKAPTKISDELSALTTYSAVSFKAFDKAKEKKAHEMSSFSENKVNSLIKKHPKEFIDFNSHHIARVYPKGTRFDSSNYEPWHSWNVGAHMVALNHQTPGDALWINQGKFQANGGTGWLLKPQFLRSPDTNFAPEMKRKVAPKNTLLLEVIGGYQLPKKKGSDKEETGKGNVTNPYVVVKIRGVGQDKADQKTKTVKNNGFTPIWNKEMKFAITVPELAHVLFVVMNDVLGRDDFIAQYSLAVLDLATGYHVVPLRDDRGTAYQSAALLVRVQWK